MSYSKCPYIDYDCEWKMTDKHIQGYEYLNATCYLSGGFENKKCPYRQVTNKLIKICGVKNEIPKK